MKIRRVGDELFNADRRTDGQRDMTKLVVFFFLPNKFCGPRSMIYLSVWPALAEVLTSPVTDHSRATMVHEHGTLVELCMPREARRSRRTTCPSVTISTTTVTWKVLEQEQGLCDEKTANNCFAYVPRKWLPATIFRIFSVRFNMGLPTYGIRRNSAATSLSWV